MSSSSISRPDLDLTGTSCPMAFVKARMYLDQCKTDKIVQILYEDTPANEPLARSIQGLGHTLLPMGLEQGKAKNSSSVVKSRAQTVQLKTIMIQVKK